MKDDICQKPPVFLRELNRHVRFLKGVGPRLSARFEKLGIRTVAELLHHIPRQYEDRREISPIREAAKKPRANVIAEVVAFDYIGRGMKQTLKVFIRDSSGIAALLCFGRNFLERVLTPGARFFFSGTFTYRFGELQCSNFEYVPEAEYAQSPARILPLYPLTEGLSQKIVQRTVGLALAEDGKRIRDELPDDLRVRYAYPAKADALESVHFPPDEGTLSRAREALIYEELFYLELVINRRALARRVNRAMRPAVPGQLKERLLSRLPFNLTEDQTQVMREIEADLFSPFPMRRLLEGDVGTGKTLVGLVASLTVIEAGEQAVFMAPTELLARQHAAHIAALVEPLGVRTALLTGSLDEKSRTLLLQALAEGGIDLVIGTHALFSESVAYRKLGLVIIDEQHRFGVLQRKALTEKGAAPDLLLMTATPIPRSLALTAFGDLDSSRIKTKPAGRRPVVTHLTRQGNETRVYERVRRELEAGHQAYFIYPLIEESEKLDLKNAVGMYEHLCTKVFPEFRFGLIHSRLPEDEKRRTMELFARGELAGLAATSVVEVGVDVRNATCMVIEHAERFGLSALHQLRGRVGRSDLQAYAFLIYAHDLTEEAIRRLLIMKQTTDGFQIAEEDLRIRGPGALLGVEQSGYFRFCFADLSRDIRLLARAKADAESVIREDPGLLQPAHGMIREVLEKAPPFQAELADTG
ncbi:MAG TPA: ATP-dependent DNA helicase RecG [Spirochaetia bacterium]|nr:ATP-dependent DNA helicase RecG [Spirochaetia bacterium]